jgi:hypothetical protein
MRKVLGDDQKLVKTRQTQFQVIAAHLVSVTDASVVMFFRGIEIFSLRITD